MLGVKFGSNFLQMSGFLRLRNRRIGASSRQKDPSGAGFYVFGSRRWRNPDNQEDHSELHLGLSELRDKFSHVVVDISKVLHVLRYTIDLWEQCMFMYAPKKKQRRGNVLRAEQTGLTSRTASAASTDSSSSARMQIVPYCLSPHADCAILSKSDFDGQHSSKIDKKNMFNEAYSPTDIAPCDEPRMHSDFGELFVDCGDFGDIGR